MSQSTNRLTPGSPPTDSAVATEQVRPSRLFELKDRVIIRQGNCLTKGVVWGYEYSEGKHSIGRLKERVRGWFYHVKEEDGKNSRLVHESSLLRCSG